MKKIIFIVFMFLLPFNAVTQNHLLLMIDKSKSMIQSSKQDKFILDLVMSKCNTDKTTFEVRFINGNSNSVANSKEFIYSSLVFDASRFSDDDIEIQKILFKSKMKRRKKLLAKQIISFINMYRTDAKYTNLLGSLGCLTSKKDMVEVYFFSDGIESSHDFRMLDVYPFKNSYEAIFSAQKDVKKLRTIYGVSEKLKIKKVSFFMPFIMDREIKGNRFIDFYWRAVFAEFGVDNVSFKTL